MKKINRLLIANRGEIACRIIDTARRLDIETVAVHHRLDHKARHARLADQAEVIEGATPVAAYLDVQQLMAVAKRKGCDAVHPGYGFLSENASFASEVQKAGLVFVGPGSKTIELMGDKIAAREFAASHGVPVSPSVTATGDIDAFIKSASGIGFPLLIKAAAGGGGKGMSIVRSSAELAERAAISASEAQRYFGDSRIYAERYIDKPRHIEVQVFGDGHGAVVHLGERECSVQRRFQKIIEEAPSVNLPVALRDSIIEAAVKLASAAKYKNAGTVEFIVAPDGSFYFLEMNTRLQVEHRVTEMITGLDLVALQLEIASGGALPAQTEVRFRGHSIECRVCAESPERDFLPETGRISCLVEPKSHEVQFDSGLSIGQNIGTNFDPMLAKLVVVGADRVKAIERMLQALASTVILGVATNVDYLSRVVGHPKFQAGEIHTGFLKEYESELTERESSHDEEHAVIIAAAMTSKRVRTLIQEVPDAYAHLGTWKN